MIRPLGALAVAAVLAGCGALAPFATAPRAAPPGAPPGQRVAICYDRLATTLAEVQAAAQPECGAGTDAVPESTDWYLVSCPVLLPARATFRCVKK